MNENDLKIVRVTNISDFDFTGVLGARYGGRDFVIQAGKSLLTPLTVGDHLATHLARQILLRKAPIRDASQTDGKGSDRPLWNEENLEELKKKILTQVYEEERPKVVSKEEMLAQKVEELNRAAAPDEDADGGNVDASNIAIDPTDSTSSEIVYKDKAQVIAELTKREIKFNARDTKANLEKLLYK